MLHRLLFEPYASPAAEARAEALQHSLAAVEHGVLLLNLPLGTELLDAVLLVPTGVALLQLLPGGRQLSAPNLTRSPWLLDGQLLPGFTDRENPYQQLQRQRVVLAAWLAEQRLLPVVATENIVCMAVFADVAQFGAELEEQLHQLPEQERFQLVRQPALMLRQLTRVAPAQLLVPAATLDAWVAELLPDEDEAPTFTDEHTAEDDLLTRKARQLWRWLGAEDVPADPPYGTASAPAPPDPVAASQQEKMRLEHIRQQIRTEVAEQTQALQAREAARDQTIAQLRQQLAEASAAAPETVRLQTQLATEAREKAALEATIRAARAESEARSQELDARIQVLGQQLQLLQQRPAPAPVGASAVAATPTSTLAVPSARPAAPARRPPAKRPAPQRPPMAATTWQLQWPRALLAGALALLAGAGIWGLAQLPGKLRTATSAPASRSTPSTTRPTGNEEAAAPTLFDIQPDTIQLTPAEVAADSAAAEEEQALLSDDSLAAPAPAAEVLDSLEAPEGDI